MYGYAFVAGACVQAAVKSADLLGFGWSYHPKRSYHPERIKLQISQQLA